MIQMKTAVIIHGDHLLAADFEEIIWGDPMRGIYGKTSKGLVEALRWDADTIIFGTGASEKDGLKEAEYILQYARKRIQEIPEFTDMGVEALVWLDKRAVLEVTAQNTREEISAGARIAKERGAKRLVQVSCRTHISRAFRDALSVLEFDPELRFFLHDLYAVSSDTSFHGSNADDVIVIDPPHRPDRPPIFFNKTIKPLVRFMNSDDLAAELNEALRKVIDEFTKRL